jgi:predicted small secreted protein
MRFNASGAHLGAPSMKRIIVMSKRTVALVAALVAALAVSACANTIRGVGRDVQQTGDAVQDAARG